MSPRKKEEFINFLVDMGISDLADHTAKEDFILGKADIELKDFEIDSLNRLELAIALEESYGLSLTPEMIAHVESLNDLWRKLP